MGAVYAVGDKFFPEIVNPDNEIALQDDRIYEIGLQAVSEFANDVEFGAVIGSRQTFQASNLTIIDDDGEGNVRYLCMCVVRDHNLMCMYIYILASVGA